MSADDVAPATIPTRHQLLAALAAGRVFPVGRVLPTEQADLAYARAASDVIYSARDLADGAQILRAAHLLDDGTGGVHIGNDFAAIVALPTDQAIYELLLRLFAAAPPVWVTAAVQDGQVAWELVPDHETSLLAAAVDDPFTREEFLLTVARRVDPEADKRTGDLAEAAVVEACRRQLADHGRDDLARRVRQVSLVSDQLGYDVTAPRLDASLRRLEVKGTRARGERFAVILSRNEARRGLADFAWSLIACRVAPDDSVSIVGWCRGSDLEPLLPLDPTDRTRWRSAKLTLNTEMLTPGLPPC